MCVFNFVLLNSLVSIRFCNLPLLYLLRNICYFKFVLQSTSANLRTWRLNHESSPMKRRGQSWERDYSSTKGKGKDSPTKMRGCKVVKTIISPRRWEGRSYGANICPRKCEGLSYFVKFPPPPETQGAKCMARRVKWYLGSFTLNSSPLTVCCLVKAHFFS